ncbi:MAG: hypothetical protein ABR576_01275, partial [Thermoanaerobaculia bacterium]
PRGPEKGIVDHVSATRRNTVEHSWLKSGLVEEPCGIGLGLGGLVPNMALQRTRRPRVRSGRSLCSLGSP